MGREAGRGDEHGACCTWVGWRYRLALDPLESTEGLPRFLGGYGTVGGRNAGTVPVQAKCLITPEPGSAGLGPGGGRLPRKDRPHDKNTETVVAPNRLMSGNCGQKCLHASLHLPTRTASGFCTSPLPCRKGGHARRCSRCLIYVPNVIASNDEKTKVSLLALSASLRC